MAVKAAPADVAFIFSRDECESLCFLLAGKTSPKHLLESGNRLPSLWPLRVTLWEAEALSVQARPPISGALTGNQSLKLAGNMRRGSWIDQ